MVSQSSFPKTEDDLRKALDRQISNMRRSMAAYDEGAIEEAERLAQSCYVLLQDGGGSRSLLGQLGLKRALTFPNSEIKLPDPPSGGELMRAPPLTVLQLGPEGTRIAPLCQIGMNLDGLPWLKFGKWWEQIIYTTSKGLKLKRMNLVFSMRNQDGGGHVDSKIDNESYHWLGFDLDPRIRITTEGSNQPVTGAHWATMRQTAWEVDQALLSLAL